MNFFTIVLRGLWRRPVRTGLTLAGIAIGIAAVVALVGIASGFESSTVKQLDVIGTDMIVSNMEGGMMPKVFDITLQEKVAALPQVDQTTSVLMQMLMIEEAPMMMVSGREWGGFTWDKLEVIEGRMPHDEHEPAVVLGIVAADVLGKKVGDKIQIEIDEFEVVGIVDGQSVVENGAILLSLTQFQKALGYEEKANFLNLTVKEDTTEEQLDALIARIAEVFPEGRAVRTRDVVGTSQGFRLVRAMSWSTSLLAIIVGVLGVMNTMLMTVFERTHEIGILLAIGWKQRMIVLLILMESAILGLVGGILGVGIGYMALELLETTKTLRGMLEADFSSVLVAQAIGIALIVGVVSGLYPAWRSSRLTPSVALQS